MKIIAILLSVISAGVCGSKYIGVSDIDIEGGYSGDKLNLGVGIRAFAYNLNRPSKLDANGDIEITAFWIQKKINQFKIQFGHDYHGSFIYSKKRSGLDAGSSIGIIKMGMEATLSESVGIYWSCVPIYLANFDLTQLGQKDFNNLDIGPLYPKIGIRMYF
jgi:hypothetical protein